MREKKRVETVKDSFNPPSLLEYFNPRLSERYSDPIGVKILMQQRLLCVFIFCIIVLFAF